MNKWLSQNIRPFRLSLVSLLLLLVGLFFLWLTPAYTLSLVSAVWEGFGGGGGCPGGPNFEMALYDHNGIRQDFDQTTSTYFGDAPLYQPDQDYPALAGRIPCDYPASLPVDVVTGWPKVYPLYMQIIPPDILSGESQPLEIKVWVDTKFSGKGYNDVFPVVIQPDEKISISFSLDASNFAFSPPNEDPGSGLIQIGRTITHVWSIAPMDDAQGEQFIRGEINGLKRATDDHTLSVGINLDVQPRAELPQALRTFLIGLGVPPGKLVPISFISSIGVGIFSVAKFSLEFYGKWLDLRQKRIGGEAKSAPKPKGKSRKPKHFG